MNKIVLDIETQKEFSEVGGRSNYDKLRISLCVAYSFADNKYFCFDESNLTKLGEILQSADQVIGYNISEFDYKVLQPYFNFSLAALPTLDILQEIERTLGHRIRLEAIAQGTLGVGKSGSGVGAVNLWKEGRVEELRKYCEDDVRLTKEIYEYGTKSGKLRYQVFFDIREILVSFPEPVPRVNTAVQTSLF